MIPRRKFILASGATALTAPFGALAQLQGKIWRIGMLETISAELNAANMDALREGLREFGYLEGRNIVIEYRSAEGRAERFADLANELLRLKVDIIVTRGTPATLAAKNATNTVPVVAAAIGEPLLVVASLAKPGANVTGLSSLSTDLEAKRIELIKEVAPGVTRIAGLMNMSNPVHRPQWKEIETAARSLGIQPRLLDVRSSGDIERALDTLGKQPGGALIVPQDALTQKNRQIIVDLAAKHRLPSVYVSREFIEAGGFIAYGPSYTDLYRRAASLVNKIFKGAKPADIPIEQPTKFELVINMKTARTLGIKIPQSVLFRADRVIE